MLKNDLFLRAARGEKVERPPVWLMRQAGRILPQYRAIRSSLSGFKELVETPALAAEVTIQPVDELGVDAAIIFSDILVIPEAMGLTYELVEKVGPIFPKVITSAADIEKLIEGVDAAENLKYVYDALDETSKQLDGRVPLIGFAGAPWTILSYMLEGKGSKTWSVAKGFLYKEPALAHQLLQKITNTTIEYLKLKVKHGAQLIQVFDSWAGALDRAMYETFALPYIKQICEALEGIVPVTVFAKGAYFAMDLITDLPCNVIGLDWSMDPKWYRENVSATKVIQGNLDPCQLYGSPESIEAKTKQIIQAAGSNHICNLGHGVYPDTPLDNVKTFVNTVKAYQY